ncbi:MAG: acyl carrier protein, partial [Candidatus Omnitrophica bacterium]|nr:acyl carrier protein [Candidatus Omnitrophota bacterium]
PEFLSDGPLHPDIREMFTQYICNDVYIINLIVGNSLGPAEKEPLAGTEIQKILSHTHTIREFMDRLREATTHKDIGPDQTSASEEELNKDSIFSKIRTHLAEEFNISEETIHSRTRFTEDMQLDSVDAIRVIMVLEEAFGFEILDQDAEKVFTVGEATDYIYKRLVKERKR